MHPSAIELARIPLRGATPPLGLRWGFEATSNDSRSTCMPKVQDDQNGWRDAFGSIQFQNQNV